MKHQLWQWIVQIQFAQNRLVGGGFFYFKLSNRKWLLKCKTIVLFVCLFGFVDILLNFKTSYFFFSLVCFCFCLFLFFFCFCCFIFVFVWLYCYNQETCWEFPKNLLLTLCMCIFFQHLWKHRNIFSFYLVLC